MQAAPAPGGIAYNHATECPAGAWFLPGSQTGCAPKSPFDLSKCFGHKSEAACAGEKESVCVPISGSTTCFDSFPCKWLGARRSSALGHFPLGWEGRTCVAVAAVAISAMHSPMAPSSQARERPRRDRASASTAPRSSLCPQMKQADR